MRKRDLFSHQNISFIRIPKVFICIRVNNASLFVQQPCLCSQSRFLRYYWKHHKLMFFMAYKAAFSVGSAASLRVANSNSRSLHRNIIVVLIIILVIHNNAQYS